MQERISAIQAKFAQDLMEKLHVVGVAIGLAMKDNEYTDELALVVMVDEKVPLEDLEEEDQIPSEIEGIRVDVQETGPIQAF
ncbi:MAG: hypothetical protein WBC91_25655 [Phototrophicaceae bacterium]